MSAARELDSALAMVKVSAKTLRDKALKHRGDKMSTALHYVAVMCADLIDAIASDDNPDVSDANWAGSKEALDAVDAVRVEHWRRLQADEQQA